MQQFDPNIPGLIEGDVTQVSILDPAGTFPPFELGNHVLDPRLPFKIGVKWSLKGLLVPLWLKALGGNWNVQAYVESVGGGPETLLTRDDSVPADPAKTDYEVTLDVKAGALPEGNPGSDISGIYKVVVAVFLNSDLPGAGFDMIGFNEGPIIQIEDER